MDDGTRRSERAWGKKAADEEEEEALSSKLGSVLKVGAAVAGTALFALGAWSLTSSSGSSQDPERKRGTSEDLVLRGLVPGGGSGGCTPKTSSYGTGITYQHLESQIIKIMTYNIWFREDVRLNERMEAIGGLIEKHSPHVIFFQEVTPNIYRIFKSSNWWRAYNYCSVPPEKASRRYFCMLLSKLPVKEFSCRCFDNSVMGRELCIADTDVGLGKKLVIATSHLESPTPPEMHSMERVAQAKEALRFLTRFPNVIFGGDMNWDEYSDGPFPVSDEWMDAWAHLRPGESGWTYDTKSNPMLFGNRPLQKRLDRFICKLRDFKIKSIDMMGMEPIPGISYCNKRKVLPVLPSDHYGLLLKIGSM